MSFFLRVWHAYAPGFVKIVVNPLIDYISTGVDLEVFYIKKMFHSLFSQH